MTRNIDILREIGKEIEAFRYAEDDLGVELDVEGRSLYGFVKGKIRYS